MVSAIVVLFVLWLFAGWSFNFVSRRQNDRITTLERENLRLARAVLAIDEGLTSHSIDIRAIQENIKDYADDYGVRIAYLESSLTSKATEAKIVPKASKMTFRRFAQAAEAASEEEKPE